MMFYKLLICEGKQNLTMIVKIDTKKHNYNALEFHPLLEK